jgi:hypothetical protein
MHPALDEESQLAPSQFAHLKTIQPSTTTSVSKSMCSLYDLLNTLSQGITPGRALFDQAPSAEPPVVLNRSQRTRKPSARKAEACEFFLGT